MSTPAASDSSSTTPLPPPAKRAKQDGGGNLTKKQQINYLDTAPTPLVAPADDEFLQLKLIKQGAEARVYSGVFFDRACIVKERFIKQYRNYSLDHKLSSLRLQQEVRCMSKLRKSGLIYVPSIYCVDEEQRRIYMEYVHGDTIKHAMQTRQEEEKKQQQQQQQQTQEAKNNETSPSSSSSSTSSSSTSPQISSFHLKIAHKIGVGIAGIHNAGVIHGDLTTSNFLLVPNQQDEIGTLVLIDFGLSSVSQLNEDRAVDLYVLERAFLSTHPNSEHMFGEILKAYAQSFSNASKVLAKLNTVRQRGRKRQMVG